MSPLSIRLSQLAASTDGNQDLVGFKYCRPGIDLQPIGRFHNLLYRGTSSPVMPRRRRIICRRLAHRLSGGAPGRKVDAISKTVT